MIGRVVREGGAKRRLASYWDDSTFRATVARVATLPITAVAAFVLSRVVYDSDRTGTAFAFYALLSSVPLLLPFLDLGVGASVVLAASAPEADRGRLRSIVVSGLRVLLSIGVVVAILGYGLTALDAWPTILGPVADLPHAETALTWCVGMFGLCLPLSLGQRLLLGAQRADVATMLLAVGTPAAVVCALFLRHLGAPTAYFPVAYFAGLAISAAATFVVGYRQFGADLRGALTDVLRWRAVPRTRIGRTSWPMFVQLIAGALSMHADRLILSHLAPHVEVTKYFLGAQLYLAVLSVVSAAGMSLWPRYVADPARARPLRDSCRLATLALLGAGVALGVSPVVFQFVAGDAHAVSLIEQLPWVVLIVLYGFLYPLTMHNADETGLRFQVPWQVGSMLVSVVGSILLAPRFGAPGPLVASAVAITTCQIAPFAIRSARRTAAGRGTREVVEGGSAGA